MHAYAQYYIFTVHVHEFTLLQCKVFLITSSDTEYNEADIGSL